MNRFASFQKAMRAAAKMAAVAICLCLPVFAAGKWTTVRSPNFLLISDADEKDISSVAARLEQFREVLKLLYPDLKLGDGVDRRVIVFGNAGSYREFKPKRADGSPDDAVAGFFVAGEEVNYITLSSSGVSSDPLEVAVHEYFHAVLKANFRDAELPPWLNEGLAGYFQ